jgi:hypothetical protein
MRLRLLPPILIIAIAANFVPADDPEDEKFAIPPRLVKLDMTNSKLGKVAPAVIKQTGIPFTFPEKAAGETCDGVFNGKPFWFALEMMADQTGNRIVLHDSGRKIALEPRGKSREVSDVHGAFRVVAKQVVGRALLDEGVSVYEAHLDIHWEPRFPVFRIESRPRILKATDDRGTALVAQSAGTRSQPTGALHSSTTRLEGLTRESKRIALLQGQYAVTASAKMLTFKFDDLTRGKSAVALPAREKVTATLKRVEKDEKTWEFELELAYPPDLPKFESFESWTTQNRARLVGPDRKAFATDNYEVFTSGSKVTAVYRFAEDARRGLVSPASKGWALEYEAPSPPLEFAVPFELKDIPLP